MLFVYLHLCLSVGRVRSSSESFRCAYIAGKINCRAPIGVVIKLFVIMPLWPYHNCPLCCSSST